MQAATGQDRLDVTSPQIGNQARAIEAEQARLQQTAGDQYNSSLRIYLQANTEKIERIESQIAKLIENQESKLGMLTGKQPGILASRKAKAKWNSEIGNAHKRLAILNQRLSRVEELEIKMEELAEDKLRKREPELTKSWDLERRLLRRSQESGRQLRSMAQDRQQDFDRVRERKM